MCFYGFVDIEQIGMRGGQRIFARYLHCWNQQSDAITPIYLGRGGEHLLRHTADSVCCVRADVVGNVAQQTPTCSFTQQTPSAVAKKPMSALRQGRHRLLHHAADNVLPCHSRRCLLCHRHHKEDNVCHFQQQNVCLDLQLRGTGRRGARESAS